MGRPSTYTSEVGEAIADRISQGETLRAITREEGMPPWQTVYGWMEAHPAFAERIARAREQGFDAIAEDSLAIVDDRANDPDAASRRVRSDHRLKLLAKWSPKRYGDRQVIAGDPDAPLTKTPTPAELADLLAAKLEQAGKKST